MPFSIDTIQLWLDEIAESLPDEVFKDLNGGVSLLPEIKISPHARAGDLFIMGEYVVQHYIGRLIYIYYGSIMQVYGNAPEFIIKRELRNILCHELIHHLESLAGERGLEIIDADKLRRYLGL